MLLDVKGKVREKRRIVYEEYLDDDDEYEYE